MDGEIELSEITKIFCNTCKYETKHDVKSTHDRAYQEIHEDYGQEYFGYYEYYEYRFLICRGCDTATLEEKFTCAGMHDGNGEDIYSSEYNPLRKNLGQRKPMRFLHIDKKLNETYNEIIKAHLQGLGIVTAMGIRALLEGICVVEGIDDTKAYGLAKKIDKLKSESKVPESIIEGLQSIKFIGDDAAHRLTSTEKNNISLSIDLLEALLTNLYEAKFDLEHKAELVKKAHNNKVPSELP